MHMLLCRVLHWGPAFGLAGLYGALSQYPKVLHRLTGVAGVVKGRSEVALFEASLGFYKGIARALYGRAQKGIGAVS